MTDRGDTYQFADDADGDGVEDDFDNCPFVSNFDQTDSDGDTVGDTCDNCANFSNTNQSDINGNSIGDSCDADADSDNIPSASDDCPLSYNPGQEDTDGNGLGDACDPAYKDACRADPSAASCATDSDRDGVQNAADNCPFVSNPNQGDMDKDGTGDQCDLDKDGDGRQNFQDNCAGVANPSQVDIDNDGLGDAGNFGTDNQFESCDPKECFVTDRVAYQGMSDGDKASSCLDPNNAFDTRLAIAGPNNGTTDLHVGDVIEIRLFTNRLNELHSWSSSFGSQPGGSTSILDNAIGSAGTYPNTFQVGSDPKFSTIRFKADKVGTYSIAVTTQLVNGDTLGVTSSTQHIEANVSEGTGNSSGGCSSTQAEGALGALAIGLGFAAVLRRRRA